MNSIAEAVFWVSLVIIIYTYIGYPLLLLLAVYIKKIFRRIPLILDSPLKPVTLIVCAYNEEEIIEGKIRNTQELDYPASLLKVIFVTDGSTDNTPDIIKKYPEYLLLHHPERKGKVAAMNRAMQHADTDIVVFSDANGYLNADCITKLISYYNQPGVGGVSGEKRVLPVSEVAPGNGENLYWKYESFLKNLDSGLHTVVGAAGELFSIRKHLYTPLDENVIIEDFVQSLLLCKKGYTVKYEPAAFSVERSSLSLPDEMERKIRISAGAFQAMAVLKGLLNIFRYPMVSFQYISHRVLRWTLAPIALVLLFISSGIVYSSLRHPFYGLVFLFQVIFYLAALAGWLAAKKNQKIPLFYIPFYFLFMHFCVFAGFSRYLSNGQEVTWKKAART